MRSTPGGIVCIINPSKPRFLRARQVIVDHCRAFGFPEPEFLETTMAEPGEAQASRALEMQADLVLVSGGDGTIRHVSNVIAKSGVPMGIVPAGTANIFALNVLGRTRNLDAVVRRALLGDDSPIDSAIVELGLAGSDDVLTSRMLVVAGMGRDALTINRVQERTKHQLGPLAYVLAGAGQLHKSPLPLSVSIDDSEPDSHDVWSVLIGNCGRIPGGITVIPSANPADGVLDVLRVAPRSIVDWHPIGISGMRGSKRSVPGLVHQPARSVHVTSDAPVSVQIDGDVIDDVISMKVTVEPLSLLIRGVNDLYAQHQDDTN